MPWEGILHGLWLFLPAYVSNMSPVFSAKIIPKWNHPIDGGRIHKDGKRMLGDGKTWRGLFFGGVVGALTALAMWQWAFAIFADKDFGDAQWWQVALVGYLVGAMALIGDAVESYFKRRTGRERGAPWVPFDQLDFVVFGLIAYAIGYLVLPAGWIHEHLFTDWWALGAILVLTPLLHVTVNRVGYWLGLKEVPW